MVSLARTSKLLLGLLLFCNVALAEPTQAYPPQGSMLFRGLDNKSSPTLLQDGRAQDLQNVKFTTTFAVTKRNGVDLINDSFLDLPEEDFTAITGLYYTEFSGGTEAIIATVRNNLWYNNSGTWTKISSPTITAGQNNQFVWTTALGSIIGSNDTNAPMKINSSFVASGLNLSDLTDTLTTTKIIIWFKNYLILANNIENSIERPTRFRWSDVGTIETYDDDNFIDIGALGGQQIEAVGILYDSLYFFFTNSIWKVSLVGGDEIFVVSEVEKRRGCIAKNSVQNLTLLDGQKGLAFLSKDKNIYFFNGVTTIKLSTLIEGTTADLTQGRLQYCVSSFDGRDAYWSVTDAGSTHDTILDFNVDINEWSRHTGIHANALARVIHSDSTEQVYYGNYSNGIYLIENPSLDSDVAGEAGTVDAVSTYTTTTASGLQILYDSSADFTDVTGAIVRIVSGPGLSEEKCIVATTASGIVVSSAFTVTPTTSSNYEIGAIDAFYETKWYDLGTAPKRKFLQELFLWTKEQGDMDNDISYSVDFGGIISTQAINLSGGGAVWGTAVWGVDVWGGAEALFKRVKLKAPCRFVKFKFAEDDIDETFQIYSFSVIYELSDFY